ncbi:MAG: hypothetical protein QOF47_3531, partial [Mycobacterium sp.]|nr:hypothetical protein [Mycobacterium sp.]
MLRTIRTDTDKRRQPALVGYPDPPTAQAPISPEREPRRATSTTSGRRGP